MEIIFTSCLSCYATHVYTVEVHAEGEGGGEVPGMPGMQEVLPLRAKAILYLGGRGQRACLINLLLIRIDRMKFIELSPS
jgi:hypothetical protein